MTTEADRRTIVKNLYTDQPAEQIGLGLPHRFADGIDFGEADEQAKFKAKCDRVASQLKNLANAVVAGDEGATGRAQKRLANLLVDADKVAIEIKMADRKRVHEMLHAGKRKKPKFKPKAELKSDQFAEFFKKSSDPRLGQVITEIPKRIVAQAKSIAKALRIDLDGFGTPDPVTAPPEMDARDRGVIAGLLDNGETVLSVIRRLYRTKRTGPDTEVLDDWIRTVANEKRIQLYGEPPLPRDAPEPEPTDTDQGDNGSGGDGGTDDGNNDDAPGGGTGGATSAPRKAPSVADLMKAKPVAKAVQQIAADVATSGKKETQKKVMTLARTLSRKSGMAANEAELAKEMMKTVLAQIKTAPKPAKPASAADATPPAAQPQALKVPDSKTVGKVKWALFAKKHGCQSDVDQLELIARHYVKSPTSPETAINAAKVFMKKNKGALPSHVQTGKDLVAVVACALIRKANGAEAEKLVKGPEMKTQLAKMKSKTEEPQA